MLPADYTTIACLGDLICDIIAKGAYAMMSVNKIYQHFLNQFISGSRSPVFFFSSSFN
jgi:hypothetical protein